MWFKFTDYANVTKTIDSCLPSQVGTPNSYIHILRIRTLDIYKSITVQSAQVLMCTTMGRIQPQINPTL